MQRALFRWITLATPRIPQLALAFHPANGGYRNPREAARLKGMGVRPGVPDVMIPYPAWHEYPERPADATQYYGIAIELKSATGRVTGEQEIWMQRLKEAGWFVRVCRSFDEARQVIADYFGVKP